MSIFDETKNCDNSRLLCKKCILPESRPDIWLNSEGVCNICLGVDKSRSAKQKNRLLESDLHKILNKFKGRGKYDCLVMCSGGKDSTMSLYHMKKRYSLNPLVFTFDHGFENEEAFENIKNAVEILKVDWIVFRTTFMWDIFSAIIKNNIKVPICHICAIWYMQLTYETATRYKIPLIIAGWTKAQATSDGDSLRAFDAMSKATREFIVKYLHKNPKYANFPLSMAEAEKTARKKFKTTMISPHWFLSLEPEKIISILKNELKWKAPKMSYPMGSTNCLMNFVSVFLSMRHYGYTHYHIEANRSINLGEISRQEALEMLEINFNKEFVNTILKKLDCQL
jgi:tRNA(Ile)-lysidine synthase TilS/MesJ